MWCCHIITDDGFSEKFRDTGGAVVPVHYQGRGICGETIEVAKSDGHIFLDFLCCYANLTMVAILMSLSVNRLFKDFLELESSYGTTSVGRMGILLGTGDAVTVTVIT